MNIKFQIFEIAKCHAYNIETWICVKANYIKFKMPNLNLNKQLICKIYNCLIIDYVFFDANLGSLQ